MLTHDLSEFTCRLRQTDTRARLVAELGEPTREINATPTLLSWNHEDWGVDAIFDDGRLKTVTAGGAPGRKRPLTLAFRDDYLVASMLAGLSS